MFTNCKLTCSTSPLLGEQPTEVLALLFAAHIKFAEVIDLRCIVTSSEGVHTAWRAVHEWRS